MTTLIITYEEIYDIMKIVKSLKESGLLIKGVSQAIKIEAKIAKRRISRHVISHCRCWSIRESSNR